MFMQSPPKPTGKAVMNNFKQKLKQVNLNKVISEKLIKNRLFFIKDEFETDMLLRTIVHKNALE